MTVTAGQRLTASVLNKTYMLTDTTSFPLTNPTALTDISKSWSIPANDASVGTAYELETVYSGTWEASGNFNLGFDLSGTKANLVPVASSVAGAAHNFGGVFRLIVVITATGVSGTFNIYTSGELSDLSVVRSASLTCSLNARSAGRAIDTTANNTLAVASFFSTSNASQTVTGEVSTFTRGG